MDALMEKLRAAAPQTRDTRDRRRRARLKDRHQVRVASGQEIPETGENVEGETGLLSPTATNESGEGTSSAEPTSEGEDVADRAASLLQGLRGSDMSNEGDGGLSEVPSNGDSLRVRRRRESANDERAQRRARRRAQGTSTDTTAQSIAEEAEESTTGADGTIEEEAGAEPALPTPTTIVVPPSPTASEGFPKDA